MTTESRFLQQSVEINAIPCYEEMDNLFGTDTTARADFERIEAVNGEIGLRGARGGETGVGCSESEKMSENGRSE